MRNWKNHQPETYSVTRDSLIISALVFQSLNFRSDMRGGEEAQRNWNSYLMLDLYYLDWSERSRGGSGEGGGERGEARKGDRGGEERRGRLVMMMVMEASVCSSFRSTHHTIFPLSDDHGSPESSVKLSKFPKSKNQCKLVIGWLLLSSFHSS